MTIFDWPSSPGASTAAKPSLVGCPVARGSIASAPMALNSARSKLGMESSGSTPPTPGQQQPPDADVVVRISGDAPFHIEHVVDFSKAPLNSGNPHAAGYIIPYTPDAKFGFLEPGTEDSAGQSRYDRPGSRKWAFRWTAWRAGTLAQANFAELAKTVQ
jgi:hypothetical protein